MTSDAQKNAGYLLPEQLTGHELLCVDLLIPDADEYRAAFLGAIYTLADWWNWEKTYQPGDTRASQAAFYWRGLLNDHLCISYGKHYNPRKNRMLPLGTIITPSQLSGNTKVSATDMLPQYLEDKILVGDGIEVTKERVADVEYLRISATAPAPAFSVGDYKYSAQTANHDGWLLCDDTEYLKADYPELYALIGDAFDGGLTLPDTFKLPVMAGFMPMTVGDLGNGINYTLGSVQGQNFVTLAESELPAHNHRLQSSAGVALNRSNGGVTSSATGMNAAGIFITGTPPQLNTLDKGNNMPHENRPPSITIGNLFIYSGVIS